MRHMTKMRLPHQAALLVHLDFRGGKCWDEVSHQNVTVSGTGASSTYTRHGEAISLTSAGSDYIDTGVDAPASGSVVLLCRDRAGAGAVSPMFSNGFGATDEAVSLLGNSADDVEGNVRRSAGALSFLVAAGRLSEFGAVGFSWGNPGSDVLKIHNLNEEYAVTDWDFVLDTSIGVDVRLNVRSDAAASQFGNNEFGFFALWNRSLHIAEMRGVSRQLLVECEL